MFSKDDEIGRLMAKCFSCGKCTPYCPSSALGVLDPHELMVSGEGDPHECIQCGNCSRICRRSDPFRVIRMMLAGEPVPRITDSHLDRECDIAVIPGCTVRERIPELKDSSVSVLSALGFSTGILEGDVCCLRPADYSAFSEMERRSMVSQQLSPASGKRLVTPCPECTQEYGSGVENILDILIENRDRLPRSEIPVKVTVFTGCALSSRKKEITELVSALGLDIDHVSTGCCGRDSGKDEFIKDRLRECDGSSYAITFCPRCTVNYSQHTEVLHITQLIDALFKKGLEPTDPYVCPYGRRPLGKDRTRW